MRRKPHLRLRRGRWFVTDDTGYVNMTYGPFDRFADACAWTRERWPRAD